MTKQGKNSNSAVAFVSNFPVLEIRYCFVLRISDFPLST